MSHSSSHSPAPGRDLPPHMAIPGPVVPGSQGAADTTVGTALFISAMSSHSHDDDGSESADRSASPHQPTGLRAKVKMDSTGRHYVLEPSTGLRIDISDDEEIPLDTPYYAPYIHPNALGPLPSYPQPLRPRPSPRLPRRTSNLPRPVTLPR